MSFVHPIRSCESPTTRLSDFRTWLDDWIADPRLGLAFGFALSALSGVSAPLAYVAIAGPAVASLVAGNLGARAATAVGFVSFLALEQPSPGAAMLGALVAVAGGWGMPLIVDKARAALWEEGQDASAIVLDCDGFGALDAKHGEGAGDHAFGLLHRALTMEADESDLVVHTQDRELVLVVDGMTPEAARALMARVERLFAVWLSDAGYECDLTVDLAHSKARRDVSLSDGVRDGRPSLD